MRSKSNRRTRAASELQLHQQRKFAIMMKFIQPLAGLLMLSFRNFAVRMTGTNSAFSYNLKNAVAGIYPDYTVDYSLALISRGDMPNALNPTAAGAAGEVVFTWLNNAGTGKAKDDDQAIGVVYCPALQQSVYTTEGGKRFTQTSTLPVSMFSGEVVETWIGFISADGKEVATSIYTGPVTVL